jgi:hypothetical protein
MKITRPQAEALAAFITRVRTDWRQAGVIAAIQKCENEYPLDIARALINLAADATVQTPGLLHGPGPHWLRPDGTPTPRKGDHNIPCPDHPGNVMPCDPCKDGKRPPTEDEKAALRALIEEARKRTAQQAREAQARIEKKA